MVAKKVAKKQSMKSSIRAARKGLGNMKRDERVGTVAQIMRDMIRKGFSNEKVFAAAQRRFGKRVVTEAKKHYPQWYRRQLVVRGEITRRFAEDNAHG